MLALRDTIAIVSHPIFEKIYPEILDLLRISRGPILTDPQALYYIQAEIVIPRLVKIEQALDKAKTMKSNEYPYKYLERIYKWIIDGVALRLLGFNPFAYRILSDNRAPGSIIKAGQKNELIELKKLADDSTFSILSDLTNFILLGDIAVFQKDSYLELKEVKTKTAKNSPGKTKASLQEIKMKKAEEMINGDFCIIDGKKATILPLPIAAKMYLNAIKSTMKKAERDGIGTADVGSCIKIVVLDFAKINDLNLNIKLTLDEMFQPFPKDNEVGTFNNIDLAWAEHREFARGIFPPTIHRLPTRLIADMICGKKLVTVYFDLTSFKTLFEENGFEVIVDTATHDMKLDEIFNKRTMPLEKSRIPAAITLKKDGWSFELPETILPQIIFEYLHPSTALEMVEYLYSTRFTRKPGFYFPISKNHRNLYR